MKQQFSQYLSRLPAPIVIGLMLWLASTLASILLGVFQEILGSESTSSNVMTIVMPAICIGLYLGQTTGALISRKTRWLAIICWTGLNLVALALLMLTMDTALIGDFSELGWFNLVIAVAMIVYLLIAYYCFKWGEKLGVKQYHKQTAQ